MKVKLQYYIGTIFRFHLQLLYDAFCKFNVTICFITFTIIQNYSKYHVFTHQIHDIDLVVKSASHVCIVMCIMLYLKVRTAIVHIIKLLISLKLIRTVIGA